MARRLHRLGIAFGAAAAAALPQPVRGWSQETHQTTGAIAWADLRARNPAALAALEGIARNHPDYPAFVRASRALDSAERGKALFEWLARWPDDVRTGPQDRPRWHYELRVVHGRTALWPLRNGQASLGFSAAFARLASPCMPAPQRALAIGWIIHIVGDIQQPLHAGHQMTAAFPLTDRAGELAFVHRTAGDVPTNLHQYWDKIMERSGVRLPPGAADWAQALSAMWPRARLQELRRQGPPLALFSSYLDESAQLARLVAYRGTFLLASADPARAPVVTAQENRTALALAERRIATGGYRIADMLASAMAQAAHNRGSCTN